MNSLQALRGIAALFVLFLHLAGGAQEYYQNSLFSRIFSFGHCGVDIFFTISGFIMMWVHAKDINYPQQWLFYIKRRLYRIYPSYWVAFLFPFGLYLVQGRIGNEISTQEVIKSFFLLPQEGRTLLVVSWTLVHEMIFYLLFGVLILNKRIGVAIFIAWVFSIVSFNFLTPLPSWLSTLHQFFDLRNMEFFIGMGVASFIQKYKVCFPNVLWKTAILIMGGGIIINYFFVITTYWLAVIPTTLFLLGSIKAEKLQSNIPSFILFLGKISYSLYLVHIPILLISYKILVFLGLRSSVQAFSVSFILSILGGFLFYNLVENRRLRAIMTGSIVSSF